MKKRNLLISQIPTLLGIIALLLSLWFQRGSTWDDTPAEDRGFYVVWSSVSGWGLIIIGVISFFIFFLFSKKSKENSQDSSVPRRYNENDDEEHNAAHSY